MSDLTACCDANGGRVLFAISNRVVSGCILRICAAPVVFTQSLCVSLLQQYVPLFLRKEDLDVAVAGAYKQRNAAQIEAVRSKAAEHEKAYQEIMRKVGGHIR